MENIIRTVYTLKHATRDDMVTSDFAKLSEAIEVRGEKTHPEEWMIIKTTTIIEVLS